MKYSTHLLVCTIGIFNEAAAAFVLVPSTTKSQTLSFTTSTTMIASTTSSEQNEQEFKLRTKELCNERNFKFEKVKNARDLSSVRNCPIKSGRMIRTGRVSDATENDLDILNNQIGVKTLVDLRSLTELKDDLTLDRPEVFGDFTDLVWDERKDVIKVLNEGRSRVVKKKKFIGHVKDLVGGAKKGVDTATHPASSGAGTGLMKVITSAADLAEATDACVDCDGVVIDKKTKDATTTESEIHIDEDQEDDVVVAEGEEKVTTKKRFSKTYHSRTELTNDKSRADRKERHFVSIMNEMKYVKGTLSKVRKRDLAKALIKSPGAIVSKRVRSSCKDVFLDRINEGGLHMLNELLLKQGAPGIKYVLDLCKDKTRYPVAFYCTAGKDRTGMIAAIMLAAAGVSDEDIVEDYSLSANVYAEMNDHKAMVGALSQRNLDAKTFLGAPPEVMRDTLVNIRSIYGSVDAYMDYIGFTEEDRAQLKAALLED
jgi:protein tyrosine/serine phosphatase